MRTDLNLQHPLILVAQHVDLGSKRHTSILGAFNSEARAIEFALQAEIEGAEKDELWGHVGITTVCITSSGNIPQYGNVEQYMADRCERLAHGGEA